MSRTRPGDVFECPYCGNEKEATRYDQKYCSHSCAKKDKGADDRRGTVTECKYCGEEFERSRDGQEYCGVSCANKHQYETGYRDKDKQTDKANKSLKEQGMERFREDPTTRVSKRGYKLIYIPSDHPELDSGWMKMHHFVWWKEKGELPPVDDINYKPTGQVMHHKDGNRLNNDIENLEILSNDKHTELHQSS